VEDENYDVMYSIDGVHLASKNADRVQPLDSLPLSERGLSLILASHKLGVPFLFSLFLTTGRKHFFHNNLAVAKELLLRCQSP
jgi:hypothetical protein